MLKKSLCLHPLFKVSLVVMLAFVMFLAMPKATALSGSDFPPGRLIDDSVFFNGSSMAAQQVQDFLNAKVPSCDTNGSQPSGRSGYATRADWGRANNVPPPYVCLKDYSESVSAKSADAYCGGSISAGTKSAAQIIADVGQACSMSPKAMIVLLQKEQSLITDDWPWPIQYRKATGMNCPDTADCDPSTAGFFNQVYYAARQFQLYKKLTVFNHRNGRSSYVQYNPVSSCGGSNIYMENHATAGLYNYTPYQPNASALNNLYGSGDACGAYGNRNFWRVFNDWFGSTNGQLAFAHPDGTLVRPAAGPNSGHVYLLKDGGAASATSLGVFQSWGFDFGRVKIATQGDLDLMAAHDVDTAHTSTPAPLQFREGTLVRGSAPTVYVIQNVTVNNKPVNHKSSIGSMENFIRLNYSFSDVINIPDSELTPIPEDTALTIDTPTHPNGTMVRNPGEATVYYIINGERHSMTSGNIFFSHRFKWSDVKKSTPADDQLTTSWPVAWFGEGTLVKGSGPTVYVIDLDNNGVVMTRRSFATYYNFVGLDYRFSEVMLVNDNELPTGNGLNIGL